MLALYFNKDREPNYFELLEIESTTPTPMQVKKNF